MRPLPALRLVAGDSVGVLHLQRVEVAVLLQLLYPVGLERQVGIVFHHGVEQLLALLAGQRGGFGGESVEQHGGRKLVVVVIGQRHRHIGKAEAVKAAAAAHTPHHRPVAVGQERGQHRLGLGIAVQACRSPIPCLGRTVGMAPLTLHPVVVVAHHHYHVARAQLVLAVEHLRAYAPVVYHGPLVAAGYDYGLVKPGVAVAPRERVDKFPAAHSADIGKAAEAHLGQRHGADARDHAAHGGGVEEYARAFTLAEHGVELGLVDAQPVALHHGSLQGRALGLAHRGQLGAVADEQQAAVAPAVYVVHEVVEQAAAAEGGLARRPVGYHRRLVDDEERV